MMRCDKVIQEVVHGDYIEEWILGYLAGILDGEGCISIKKDKPNDCINPCYQVSIRIGMLTKEPLEIFHNIFGGSLYKEKRKKGNPLFRWEVRCKNAEIVIKKLLPFLIVKKEHSKISLKMRESKIKRYYKLPKHIIEYREDLFQRMKRLNGG